MDKEINNKTKIIRNKNTISLKTKQKNRRKALLFLFSLVFLGMSLFYINEIIKFKDEKKLNINKNMFLLEESFLLRKYDFYKDENYLKKYEFLKKNWLKNTGGIKFDEQPEKEI
ncbi:MAG: hypothetical protein ACRC0S_08395 [Fusobacteriaceae bacterium]